MFMPDLHRGAEKSTRSWTKRLTTFTQEQISCDLNAQTLFLFSFTHTHTHVMLTAKLLSDRSISEPNQIYISLR